MTVSIANSNDDWISDLTDSGIKADASSLAADGTLSYGDLLKILTDVVSANTAAHTTITVAQFNSLQTIAANLNIGVATSDYAASTFIQLVDGSAVEGSQANAYWTGGAQTTWTGGSSTPPTTLGDLKAGTTTTQLTELIGKWFSGTDLPDPTVYEESNTAVSYKSSNLPLYGSTGAPVVGDISQGADGDCELCAGLVELAVNDASAIESMIVSDGSGVYGVRFYVDGNEMWQTVNSELPVYSGGSLVYMNEFNSSDPLWADLVEKAYAQLSSTGLIGHPAQNSYDNIAADYADDVLTDLTDCSSVNYYYYSDSNWTADEALFIQAVDTGDDVILESYGATKSGTKQELVDDHAFAIVGYDSSTGDFIVRNPWGTQTGGAQNYVTQFEVSMTTIASVKGDVVIANSAASDIEVLTAPEGSRSSSSGSYSFPDEVVAGASCSVTPFFSVIDTAGNAITEYMFQAIGSGQIELNGATDLANPAEQAQGEYVVAAGDLSKITYLAGQYSANAPYGSEHLLVWAYDGTTWSPSTDISLTPTKVPIALAPAIDVVVAPSATVAVSSLFTTLGSMNSGTGYYEVDLESGGGSLSASYIPVSQLSTATYTAPSMPGLVTLDAWAYNGSKSSDEQALQLYVGTSVAAAIQDYDNGGLSDCVAVADSAANIFANLDGLQTMLAAGVLQAITVTDSTAPTESITGAQDTRDKGLLSILRGNYSLNVSGPTGPALSVSSSSHSQTASDLAIGGSVSITLNMSEQNLKVSGTPGLTLSDGGTANYVASASNLTAGVLVFKYTVTAGQNAPDLQVTGAASGTWSVTDQSGNEADFSGAVQDLGLVVDTDTPAVSGVTAHVASGPTPNAGYAVAGDTVEIDIALSDGPLVVTGGSPVLKLGSLATTFASTATDLTDGILAFDYTLAKNQKLTALKISSLTLPKGIGVTDGAGNAANLKLTSTEENLGLTADGTPPTVKSVKASPTKNIGNGSTVSITLTMSEDVTVTGAPSLALSDSATATYVSGSGTKSLVFAYKVGAESTTDLEITGINESTGNTIADAAGNALSPIYAGNLKLKVNPPPGAHPQSADLALFVNSIASFAPGSGHGDAALPEQDLTSPGFLATSSPHQHHG